MSHLIINADDLSIHPRIDQGIRQAFEQGIVTSTTMLVTTEFSEQSVKMVVHPTGIPVGLHLSLSTGKSCALASAVPLLTNEDGYLSVKPAALFKKALFGELRTELLKQIRHEFDAQFQRAKDLGLDLTHCDSHQHVHMVPGIYQIVEDVASRYGVTKIRFVRENLYGFSTYVQPLGILKRKNLFKWGVLRWSGHCYHRKLVSPDNFFGVIYSGIIDKATLVHFIKSLKPGRVYELALHPGLSAGDDTPYPQKNQNEFISSPAREVELNVCLGADIKTVIDSYNIKTLSYSEF